MLWGSVIQGLQFLPEKITFFRFNFEFNFPNAFEDYFQMFNVLFRSFTVDNNIIKIDNYKFTKPWSKYFIHEVLEGCWRVIKAEGHNTKLVMSTIRLKGCFMFMVRSNSNLVKCLGQIQSGETSCSIK